MNSFKRGLFLAVFLLTTFLFTRFAMNITQSYEQVKPHVFYLHIDNDFTKTEIQEIYNAGNLWTKASNGMIEFKFDIRPVEMNLSHMDKMKDNIWRAKLNTKSFNAFENSIANIPVVGYAPPNKYIVIVPELIGKNKKFFETVVAHELGHHIGLTHTPAIMDSLPRTPCITHFDLEQVCSRYDCSAKVKNKLDQTCLP